MAPTSHLPVYIASYDLLLDVFQCVKGFPREYKYTIGQEMRLEVMSVLRNIFRANGSWEHRTERIISAREHIEALRIYIRLARDLHVFSLAPFVRLSERVETVSRQLLGWERSMTASSKKMTGETCPKHGDNSHIGTSGQDRAYSSESSERAE